MCVTSHLTFSGGTEETTDEGENEEPKRLVSLRAPQASERSLWIDPGSQACRRGRQGEGSCRNGRAWKHPDWPDTGLSPWTLRSPGMTAGQRASPELKFSVMMTDNSAKWEHGR